MLHPSLGLMLKMVNKKFTLERFAVWMRTSGLPDFRKTWGKIDSDIKAGEYTIEVDNS